MTQLIGVDVGGTNLRVGVVEDHRIVYEKRFHADFSGICQQHQPEIALQKIVEITANALNEAVRLYPAVKAAGIGFPGFIHPDNGVLIQSPNLPGLRNVNLATPIEALMGLPVLIENDALVAAYGEYCLHPYDTDSLIYIGLGTGVGGGLIYGRQPFAGQHGVAMEAGHLIVKPNGRICGCGNRGCVETYASATGISYSYHEATGKQLSAEQIFLAGQQGDEDALSAYRLAATTLAQALAHVVKVVDVGAVVIGGGASQAWPLMQKAFDQQLQADMIPALRDKITVSISSCGDQAGVIGAAALAGFKKISSM